MLAFRTPFVDHGGIAMAGELPVMGGPLGPRSSGGGLDGFRLPASADEYRGG